MASYSLTFVISIFGDYSAEQGTELRSCRTSNDPRRERVRRNRQRRSPTPDRRWIIVWRSTKKEGENKEVTLLRRAEEEEHRPREMKDRVTGERTSSGSGIEACPHEENRSYENRGSRGAPWGSCEWNRAPDGRSQRNGNAEVGKRVLSM